MSLYAIVCVIVVLKDLLSNMSYVCRLRDSGGFHYSRHHTQKPISAFAVSKDTKQPTSQPNQPLTTKSITQEDIHIISFEENKHIYWINHWICFFLRSAFYFCSNICINSVHKLRKIRRSYLQFFCSKQPSMATIEHGGGVCTISWAVFKLFVGDFKSQKLYHLPMKTHIWLQHSANPISCMIEASWTTQGGKCQKLDGLIRENIIIIGVIGFQRYLNQFSFWCA